MSKYRAYSSREQAVEAGIALFQGLTGGTIWNDPKESIAMVDTVAGGILAVAPGHPEMFAENATQGTVDDLVQECGCDCDELEKQLQKAIDEKPQVVAKGKHGAHGANWMEVLSQALAFLKLLLSLRNS